VGRPGTVALERQRRGEGRLGRAAVERRHQRGLLPGSIVGRKLEQLEARIAVQPGRAATPLRAACRAIGKDAPAWPRSQALFTSLMSSSRGQRRTSGGGPCTSRPPARRSPPVPSSLVPGGSVPFATPLNTVAVEAARCLRLSASAARVMTVRSAVSSGKLHGRALTLNWVRADGPPG
jgi:hypothetical protein